MSGKSIGFGFGFVGNDIESIGCVRLEVFQVDGVSGPRRLGDGELFLAFGGGENDAGSNRSFGGERDDCLAGINRGN